MGTRRVCQGNCLSEDVITQPTISLIVNSVLPPLQQIIESMLEVNKPSPSDNIVLPPDCFGVPTPAQWRSPGTSSGPCCRALVVLLFAKLSHLRPLCICLTSSLL